MSEDTYPGELKNRVESECWQAAQVAEGSFLFLGVLVRFAGGVEWHNRDVSQLWRYHLQYFGYVRPLLVASKLCSDDKVFHTFRKLVLSWNKANILLIGDGWHPYTLSLRIVNWIQAWCHWQVEFQADAEFRDAFIASLSAQGRTLRKQLEHDVRGNHLLENARALLWLGCTFNGDEAGEWFAKALDILQTESNEQILTDGGHFERSPGYHVVVLRNFLELGLLLERNTRSCPSWLREVVRRQSQFLRGILGPENRLPLLKDTALDAVPEPADVLCAAAAWLNDSSLKVEKEPGLETFLMFGGARWRSVSQPLTPMAEAGVIPYRSSGFYVLRGGSGAHAILDVGKPCPDYLPAHAHADTFSYEYHFAGRPIVVDSGVFEYQAGPWRDYFRSTRAHNTLEIDDENSSEVWSSFRVGRRARPRLLSETLSQRHALVYAEHDGYRHLPGRPIHRRAFAWRDGEYFMVIDNVAGSGTFNVATHLHFHPTLQAVNRGEGRWEIPLENRSLWLFQFGWAEVDTCEGVAGPRPQGWYSERFGEKYPNRVLTFSENGAAGKARAYVLTPHQDLSASISYPETSKAEIVIEAAGRVERYKMSDAAIELVA